MVLRWKLYSSITSWSSMTPRYWRPTFGSMLVSLCTPGPVIGLLDNWQVDKPQWSEKTRIERPRRGKGQQFTSNPNIPNPPLPPSSSTPCLYTQWELYGVFAWFRERSLIQNVFTFPVQTPPHARLIIYVTHKSIAQYLQCYYYNSFRYFTLKYNWH